MDWYVREVMAENRQAELEKETERRRLTTGRPRPVEFWLLAVLRNWLITATR